MLVRYNSYNREFDSFCEQVSEYVSMWYIDGCCKMRLRDVCDIVFVVDYSTYKKFLDLVTQAAQFGQGIFIISNDYIAYEVNIDDPDSYTLEDIKKFALNHRVL